MAVSEVIPVSSRALLLLIVALERRYSTMVCSGDASDSCRIITGVGPF